MLGSSQPPRTNSALTTGPRTDRFRISFAMRMCHYAAARGSAKALPSGSRQSTLRHPGRASGYRRRSALPNAGEARPCGMSAQRSQGRASWSVTILNCFKMETLRPRASSIWRIRRRYGRDSVNSRSAAWRPEAIFASRTPTVELSFSWASLQLAATLRPPWETQSIVADRRPTR